MANNNETFAISNLSLVLGYLAVKDIEGIENQVSILARLGYDNSQIAVICDVTPASVRSHKYAGKKKEATPLPKTKKPSDGT